MSYDRRSPTNTFLYSVNKTGRKVTDQAHTFFLVNGQAISCLATKEADIRTPDF